MARSTRLLTYLTAALAPCVVAAATPASAADETYSVSAAVTIPNNPISNPTNILRSWDISFVDATLGLFFLGDRTNNQVSVIDTGTNTAMPVGIGRGLFTGAIPCPLAKQPAGPNDCAGPDGVLAVNHKELWVGDGDSTVKVFDLTNPSHPLTHTISTGGVHRADELCFDPENQLVLVANNAEDPFPFATIISVKHHAVVKRITFDGTKGTLKALNGVEQCQYSARTERFYITLPGVDPLDARHGAVAVINPEDLDDAKLVEKNFDIDPAKCDTPQGMAVGPDHQLLIGCNGNGSTTKSSVVIDARNGAILATVANEAGPDEVWYNPGDGSYFLARSAAAGTNQLLGIIDARGLVSDADAITAPKQTALEAAHLPKPIPAPNSHSVAADPVKNQIYVAVGGRGASATACGASGSPGAMAGCIAVFTSVGKDDRCLAEGAPIREANAGEDPVFLHGKCRDHDRHARDDDRDHDR